MSSYAIPCHPMPSHAISCSLRFYILYLKIIKIEAMCAIETNVKENHFSPIFVILILKTTDYKSIHHNILIHNNSIICCKNITGGGYYVGKSVILSETEQIKLNCGKIAFRLFATGGDFNENKLPL
jgi:hypothetical protein